MLTPEDPAGRQPAQRRDGRSRRAPHVDVVCAVLLLAGICVGGDANAQGALNFERSPPDQREPATQGQPLVVPSPKAPPPKDPKFAPPTASKSKYTLPKGLAQQVQALAAKRGFAKAIALIDEALKRDSGNAELLRLRAIIHCRAGNTKVCLQDASRAVEADKAYIPSYLYRASVRVAAGQAKEALDDCRHVIKLQPDNPLGYNCRGIAHRGLREFDQAIADFDEALRRSPKLALAHYNKGVTYILLDKFKDAVASLTTALDINPKYDDALAQRGKARIALGDVAGARADFTQAMALNRRNFVAIVGMQGLHVGKALDTLTEKKKK